MKRKLNKIAFWGVFSVLAYLCGSTLTPAEQMSDETRVKVLYEKYASSSPLPKKLPESPFLKSSQAKMAQPTTPSLGKVVRKPKLSIRLNGILSRPEESIAIVNGKMVREGDYVGSARVENIKPEYIEFSLGSTKMRRALKVPTLKSILTKGGE